MHATLLTAIMRHANVAALLLKEVGMKRALFLLLIGIVLSAGLWAGGKAEGTQKGGGEATASEGVNIEVYSAAEGARKQANDGKLHVGIVVSPLPPRAYFEDADPSKPLRGYEVDIITEIARRLDKDVVFYAVAWPTLFTGLLADKWDMAASNIFIKKEREDMMDFAEPYLDADVACLAKKETKIDKLEDLKGKVLGCVTGSGPELWLRDNMEKYGPYELRTYEGHQDSFLDVETGRLDGAFTDLVAVDWYVREHDTMKRAVTLGLAYRVGFAFRPGDPLVPEVTKALQDMKREKFIMNIYYKYYNVYPPENSAANIIFEKGYFPES
jgi:polar amino acid transport system substrate-binding protein